METLKIINPVHVGFGLLVPIVLIAILYLAVRAVKYWERFKAEQQGHRHLVNYHALKAGTQVTEEKVVRLKHPPVVYGDLQVLETELLRTLQAEEPAADYTAVLVLDHIALDAK